MSTTVHASSKQTRRARRDNPNRPRPETPILIVTAGAAGSVLTLTLDQPVLLSGTPAFTTDVGGAIPVSATRPALNQVAITFSGNIAAMNQVNLTFRDPAIRNTSGGFVTSNTYIL
jgi:hypothetical protein